MRSIAMVRALAGVCGLAALAGCGRTPDAAGLVGAELAVQARGTITDASGQPVSSVMLTFMQDGAVGLREPDEGDLGISTQSLDRVVQLFRVPGVERKDGVLSQHAGQQIALANEPRVRIRHGALHGKPGDQRAREDDRADGQEPQARGKAEMPGKPQAAAGTRLPRTGWAAWRVFDRCRIWFGRAGCHAAPLRGRRTRGRERGWQAACPP